MQGEIYYSCLFLSLSCDEQGSETAASMRHTKSLVVEEDDQIVFPKQQIMHKFRDVSMLGGVALLYLVGH